MTFGDLVIATQGLLWISHQACHMNTIVSPLSHTPIPLVFIVKNLRKSFQFLLGNFRRFTLEGTVDEEPKQDRYSCINFES